MEYPCYNICMFITFDLHTYQELQWHQMKNP